MATQSASSPAGRDISKAGGFDTKVAVGNGKKMLTKSQPIAGKLAGMNSMPGSKGKGQAVTTVKSNPISGSANMQAGNTAMGNGAIKSGFI